MIFVDTSTIPLLKLALNYWCFPMFLIKGVNAAVTNLVMAKMWFTNVMNDVVDDKVAEQVTN